MWCSLIVRNFTSAYTYHLGAPSVHTATEIHFYCEKRLALQCDFFHSFLMFIRNPLRKSRLVNRYLHEGELYTCVHAQQGWGRYKLLRILSLFSGEIYERSQPGVDSLVLIKDRLKILRSGKHFALRSKMISFKTYLYQHRASMNVYSHSLLYKGLFVLHINCIALRSIHTMQQSCCIAALHPTAQRLGFILTWNAVKLQWLAAKS